MRNSLRLIQTKILWLKLLISMPMAYMAGTSNRVTKKAINTPTETKGALDELSSRLTTAVSPLVIHPTTASVGVDRDAARADHVHSHSDLSGAVTTHHDTVQIENTQTTPADWLVGDGSNVQAHLDEVGSRLNTSIATLAVHPTTGSVGTSLESAHADHVHSHADLSGTVTTHHDTVQSVHTQGVPANWATTDGANVKLHLDELAARTITAVAPTGALMAYAGPSAPAGWLFCDGSSKDSDADSTLTPLFTLIGTTYGGQVPQPSRRPSKLAQDGHARVALGSGRHGAQDVRRAFERAQGVGVEGGVVRKERR